MTDSQGELRHRSFGFYVIALCRCADEEELRAAALDLPVLSEETDEVSVGVPESTRGPDGVSFSRAAVSQRCDMLRAILSHYIEPPSSDTLPLMSAGLDSLKSVQFAERLSAELDVELPETIVFYHPSIAELAAATLQMTSPYVGGATPGNLPSADLIAKVKSTVLVCLSQQIGKQRAETLSETEPLMSAGLDSLKAVAFAERVGAELNVADEIEDTLIFYYPTIGELVPHLAGLAGPSEQDAVDGLVVPSHDSILTIVQRCLRQQLGPVADTVKNGDALMAAGLDSLKAVSFAESLEEAMGIDIPETVVFYHPTVEQLVAHLREEARGAGKLEALAASRSGPSFGAQIASPRLMSAAEMIVSCRTDTAFAALPAVADASVSPLLAFDLGLTRVPLSR